MIDYSSLFTGKTPAPQAPATHLTTARYRLLLVDDEPDVVKTLARVFAKENYDIVTAWTAREGLEKLSAGPVHLVITGFTMPGMNGAQFLQEVKKRSPETIRIMLTGHANTDAVMGAINEGAVHKFILKPWQDNDLRVTVALALEQFDLLSRQAKEIAAPTAPAASAGRPPLASASPNAGGETVIADDINDKLEDLLGDSVSPPALRLANAIILEASRLGASAIHLQPRNANVVIHYRIDGVLSERIHMSHQVHLSLVSHLKVMAGLDISEQQRPQDGRITIKTPRQRVDLQLSTLPTIKGEKVVIRIRDPNAAVYTLNKLDFSAFDLPRITEMLAKPQGVILVTGPAGSGKTSTLNALLQHDARAEKSYVTIENPVQYCLTMADQVQVCEKLGLSFPALLRALLRQTPDVVLLGEMRDSETAELAFNAALSGQLVYSALPANSATSALACLFDLGLKPYVVATALAGIITQRLLRRVCADCSAPAAPDPSTQARLGKAFAEIKTVFRGRGCSACHGSGYRGQVGIYEVLILDDELRDGIGSGASLREMSHMVGRKNLHSMTHHAFERVAAGATTLDEILRVLGPMAGEV